MWGDVDHLAGLGVGEQAVRRVVVLQVEDVGDRPGGASRLRVRRRIVDTVVPEVEAAAAAREVCEVLLAGSCAHRFLPFPHVSRYRHRTAAGRRPTRRAADVARG